MKFIMSVAMIGLIVLSCKKERTERVITTDSIIADTMRADTITNVTPLAPPLPSDTVRSDSNSSKKHQDTTRKTRTNQKK